MRRSACIGALALGAWSFPAPAQTPPDVDACLAAHEQGQIARKHDKLVDARRAFAICAVDACPKLARDDCATWLGEVDALVPSIELALRDSTGGAVASARCTLDGALLEPPLEARAIPVDPGAHALHCEADALPPLDRALAIASTDRRRRIDVLFDRAPEPAPSTSASVAPPLPPAPPPSASTRPPSPTPPDAPPSFAPVFVSGGIALAAFATFAYLGASGVSREDDLRSTCKPYCSPSDVNALRTRYNVADVFLGAGIVATGVTAWLYFTRRAPTARDARLGIQAIPGGGGARVAVPF